MTTLQLGAWLGYLALLAYVAKHTVLSNLGRDRKLQHLVFGSAASVFVLWLFRAGIYDGLGVHFLWLPALTLLLGFRWAILASAIALVGTTLVGRESWALLGINGLLGVSLPIALSYLVYNLTFHKMPRHFMIYVFICAFLTGAAAIALKMFALGGYFYLDGIHDWLVVKENYLILIPLLLFPEALLNGMTMTLLIIYFPSWVYTFYDKFYLDKQ